MRQFSLLLIAVISLLVFDNVTCIAESRVKMPNSSNVFVPGLYLEAWKVAYADFLQISDLTEIQKKLDHYEIIFTEDNNNYIVLFRGRLLSEEEAKRYNRIIMGRETKYWIDKKTLKILKREFYK